MKLAKACVINTSGDVSLVLGHDINGAGNIAKKYLETFCEQSQDRPVVGLGRPWMYRFNGSRFVT